MANMAINLKKAEKSHARLYSLTFCSVEINASTEQSEYSMCLYFMLRNSHLEKYVIEN